MPLSHRTPVDDPPREPGFVELTRWGNVAAARGPWLLLGVAALLAIWLATGTQREKPVLAQPELRGLRALENDAAMHPADEVKTIELATAYLDAHAPGTALALLERAPEAVRVRPAARHVLGRTLFDQGRATDALRVEKELQVLCNQSPTSCPAGLLASVIQRTIVLDELVKAGIEDAQAHPEAAAFAFQKATHPAFMSP